MSRIVRCVIPALVALAAGCASLPSPEGRVPSTVLGDTARTPLALAVAPVVSAHPGKAGIHPLFDPRDAFAARALLAAAAGKSIDAQYYIWHGDAVGNLLFEALRQAAGRGVRVRLLLDDMNTKGIDPVIAALDAHPNIEVRLYNPFAHRSARSLDFLADFSRVNRRMHNKSFTADNQASIVGGRNIGNEYYGVGEGTVFADLDVIAIGAVVKDISRQFDLYWNSASAYPAASIVGRRQAGRPRRAVRRGARRPRVRRLPRGAAHVAERARAPRRAAAVGMVGHGFVHDDPGKTLETTNRRDVLLFPALMGGDRPAGEVVRPRLPVLRAWRRRHRGPGGARPARGDGARPHQFARVVRGERGPCRLCQASRGAPACRVRLFELRATAPAGEAAGGRNWRGLRLGLRGGAAREDLRRGREPHLRRLVQLRPALGAAQYRTGPRDRKPEAGRTARGGVRQGPAPFRVRGPVARGWRAGVDREDHGRREAPRDRARRGLVPARGRGGAVRLPIDWML